MSKPRSNTVPHGRLKELLEYRNGRLYWRVNRVRARAGNEAGWFSNGYRRVTVDKIKLRASHIVWALCHGRWPALELDHVNGDKQDDRIENLREATHQQNGWNQPASPRNTSGVKGVHFHKKNRKWTATIRAGAPQHLGSFDSCEAAAVAYNAAATRLHGEFRHRIDS